MAVERGAGRYLARSLAALSTLGSSPPRPDGASKVGGTLRYANDLPAAGMWHGATLRSPHPHARIRRLRWHPERAPAGAVCVTAERSAWTERRPAPR